MADSTAHGRESAPEAADDQSAVEPTDATAPADGPTRVGTATVVLFGVVTALVLTSRVGPTPSVALAFVHAALFAASLWLVDRERWRVVALAVAGVLALFVGASFTVAVGYAALDLISGLYPVQSVDQIRPRGLRVVSVTGVVLGGTLAMVGALTAVGDRLRSETVWAHAKLAVKTFVVPLAVAAVALASALLGQIGGGGEAPLLNPLTDAVGGLVGAVVTPAPGRTHLLSACLLLSATAFAVGRAVESLPLAELATPPTDDRVESLTETVRTVTRRTAVAAAALLPVTLVEVVLRPADLRGLLSPAVYDALAALTASAALRVLLTGTLVLSSAVVATVWLLRRTTRTEPRAVALELTPFLGGAAVVGLVVALHGAVLPPVLEFVAARLPGAFETAFARQSTAVVDFYGSLPVVMALAALLVGATALLSLALAFVMTAGALPETAPGPALAAAGLFVGAAFARGSGVGAPLVLGSIVVSLVVWDAGEFGTTLGREVGRAGRSAAPEFVHVGATLAVGVASALVAAGVYAVAAGAGVGGLTTLPFALAVAVTGLLLLVAALR